MKRTPRRTLQQREDEVRSSRHMIVVLSVMTAIAGLAALVFMFQDRDVPWPRPFAWAWFVVLGGSLVEELLRRRSVRQAAARRSARLEAADARRAAHG